VESYIHTWHRVSLQCPYHTRSVIIVEISLSICWTWAYYWSIRTKITSNMVTRHLFKRGAETEIFHLYFARHLRAHFIFTPTFKSCDIFKVWCLLLSLWTKCLMVKDFLQFFVKVLFILLFNDNIFWFVRHLSVVSTTILSVVQWILHNGSNFSTYRKIPKMWATI